MDETPRVVTGTIPPITFDEVKRRLDRQSDEITVTIPTPGLHGARELTFVSLAPIVCTAETLEYAFESASRVIAIQGSLEVNELSSRMLAMAYAVLHAANKDPQ